MTTVPTHEDLLREISELKKQLAIKHDRYKTIFEQAGDAISLIDLDGHFLEVNKAFSQRLGYSFEELSSMTVQEITSKRFKESVDKRIKLLQEQGAVIAETEHLCRDGRLVSVELDARLIEIEKKIVILTISRDISRRKQIERCRQLEQNRFVSVLEAIPEGLYIVSQQYNIEYVNAAIKQEFGLVEGRKCFQYLHNRMNPCPDCTNKEVFKGQTISRCWHSELNNKDYEITDSLLEDVDDIPAKVVFLHDITEIKRTKSLLEQNREILENIINNSGAVIYVKDVTGRYLLVNTLFNELFNQNGQDVIGMSDFDFFPKEQARTLQRHDQQILASGRVQQFEEKVQHSDGRHIYLSTKFIIRGSDGFISGIAGISTDITRRKQMESECQHNRDLLVALINSSPDIICFKDGEGRVLMANEAYRYIFQLEEENYLLKTESELASLYPDFNDIFLTWSEGDESCWAKGLLSNKVIKIQLINGTEYIYDTVKVPLFNADGTRRGLVVQAHDISQRHRTEEMLRNEVKSKKLAAQALEKKQKEIEEANIALKVLIRRENEILTEYQKGILSQLERGVFPYLDLLKPYLEGKKEAEYLKIICRHLRHLEDTFIPKIDRLSMNLTKKEILVVDLIKQGKCTKEISQLLGLRPRSIESYRNSIRKKLHINKKKITLVQYLNEQFPRNL